MVGSDRKTTSRHAGHGTRCSVTVPCVRPGEIDTASTIRAGQGMARQGMAVQGRGHDRATPSWRLIGVVASLVKKGCRVPYRLKCSLHLLVLLV